MTKNKIALAISFSLLLVGVVVYFSKSKSEKIGRTPRTLSNSSCLQYGSRAQSPFDVAYCALSEGEGLPQGEALSGFTTPSAVYPNVCGEKVQSTCMPGGKMQKNYPLYEECSQFCLHPMTQTPVAVGDSFSYYEIPSGSLSECQQARKTVVCTENGTFGSTIPDKRYHQCSVINPNVGTIQYWSDPATWGGELPIGGADVVIPLDKTIIMDIDPPPLKSLEIIGTLAFDNENHRLVARTILVAGNFRIGSQDVPFDHEALVVLEKGNEFELYQRPQGLMIQGGRLFIFGKEIDSKEISKLPLPNYEGKNLKRLPYENWGIRGFKNIFLMTE